ncbi:MAG TPA: helix-turn-helix domain-containing protein, partial [Burkholderiaceae bacterium]|nr:helix-turn-helix domain-containing protein [Burkholderiaceae bacterium]
MGSLIAASARALAVGDPLGALNRISLRDDPPSLALRGIATAQLGEYPRARELLRCAARGFGSHEALARARCVVAEAEVALAMRELGGSQRSLAAAAAALEKRGDLANALQARLIATRRLLLLGRLDEAETELSRFDEALTALERRATPGSRLPAARALPPPLAAIAALVGTLASVREIPQ